MLTTLGSGGNSLLFMKLRRTGLLLVLCCALCLQGCCSRTPLCPLLSPPCQAAHALLESVPGLWARCRGQGEGLRPSSSLFSTSPALARGASFLGASHGHPLDIHCCVQLMLPTPPWCFWSVGRLLH